jgi:hypothetical protein
MAGFQIMILAPEGVPGPRANFVAPSSRIGATTAASAREQRAVQSGSENSCSYRKLRHQANEGALLQAFCQIVPPQAAVEYFTASNAEVGQPRERLIASMRFPGQPILVRCSNARAKALSDQFEYSYLRGDPPGDAVFKIRFHQALIVASTVRSGGEL